MTSHSKLNLRLSEFAPLFPIYTGHSQTIIGHLVKSPVFEKPMSREVVKLPDGDELLVEYFDNKSDFTISIYHGLGGSAQSDYIQRSAILADQFGWNIILVNHRGVSSAAVSKRSYHSGRGEDADVVLKWAKAKFKESKQIMLGFSLSGSVLMNLLCFRYGSEQPDYAVVVNAPLNLESCSRLLSTGMSKIYDLRFYLLLKKMIEAKSEMRLPIFEKVSYIDEIYTSKVNGFTDALDYYKNCSTVYYVDRIKTKTFVLTAKDDPFIDIKDYLSAAWNENVHRTILENGGHMGYFSKKRDPKHGRRWLDHYLESVFQIIQAKN